MNIDAWKSSKKIGGRIGVSSHTNRAYDTQISDSPIWISIWMRKYGIDSENVRKILTPFMRGNILAHGIKCAVAKRMESAFSTKTTLSPFSEQCYIIPAARSMLFAVSKLAGGKMTNPLLSRQALR